MTQRDICVSLTWSDQGIPEKTLDANAHLEMVVESAESKQTPGLPPQLSSVSIHGNRAGLVALATRLLAIAYTDIEGYHEHFDHEVQSGFVLHVDDCWELIVGRNDHRAIRRANDQ